MGSIHKSREDWKVYGNVFSTFSLRNIFKLKSQGYFNEMGSPLSIGKEANIFTAQRHDGSLIIVKMYRLENCNFNKMYDYIMQDNRYLKLKRNKRDIVFSWTQREYRNLLLARDHIAVPTPFAVKDNIILMEFIGDDQPASKLKDEAPKNPQAFFNEVIKAIETLTKAGLVHGDLSEYNILNHHDKPVFIDFSQATTIDSGNASNLLYRDLTNVCNFFRKRGVNADAQELATSILTKARIASTRTRKSLRA